MLILLASFQHVKEMMKLISDLYELEEAWDRAGISNAARKIKRSEQSKPIAATIKAHLDGFAADLTIPNGEFYEAVRYTANQWAALWECFEHAHTRLETCLNSSFAPPRSVRRTGSLSVTAMLVRKVRLSILY